MKRKKVFITSLLLILIPIVISVLLNLFFTFSIFISLIVVYSVLLIFLLPSDSFFGNVVDYHTKAANPTFQSEKKKLHLNQEKLEDLILFFVVLFSLLITLIIFYVKATHSAQLIRSQFLEKVIMIDSNKKWKLKRRILFIEKLVILLVLGICWFKMMFDLPFMIIFLNSQSSYLYSSYCKKVY